MTTVAELAQRETQHIGYVFVIEGMPAAWTDTLDLVGHGAGTWFGASASRPEILLGLEPPASLETGIDWEIDGTGMPADNTASFTIVDITGAVGTPPPLSMIKLIAEPDDRDFLYQRLSPMDDPAPSTLIGEGGDSVDVWGRWVNMEAIGPAGERRYYPCIYGATLPGYDHAALSSADQGFVPSIVTDTPQIQKGMRCALYLVRRDITTGVDGYTSWPDIEDQAASGYSLIWWGTVNGVSSSGPVFTVDCDGPASWLRKPCNANGPEQWLPISARLGLNQQEGAREDLIAVAFQYINGFGEADWQRGGYSIFDPGADVLTNNATAVTLRNEINSRINTLKATAGADVTFTTYRNGDAVYDSAGIRIRVDDGVPALAGVMHLCMSRRVWLFLGFDPEVQNTPYEDIETTRDIHFIPVGPNLQFWEGVNADAPGPDYWVGYFNTLPFGTSYSGADVDNSGSWRHYETLTDPGTIILQAEGQQEIGLGWTVPAIYCEGQLARPVADHVMLNGLPCDRTGFIVLRGKYRDSAEAEPIDIYQVAKVSWADSDNSFADDGTGVSTVWIEKYLDPRRFGYRNKPPVKAWSSDTIEWASLAMLGYNTHELDYAHRVILRTMLGTGTKTWSAGSYEDVDGAAFTPGVNAHPDAVAPHLQGDDQDIADITLAIPHTLIDWGSFVDAANDLPGGYKSPLNQVKVAKRGSFDVSEVIANLMKPRAFYMGLEGYRYSMFNLANPLDSDDATVTITEADIDSEAQPYVPEVNLYPFQGFDKLEIEYHYPAGGDGGETATLSARPLSSRVRARNGNAIESMTGEGMVDGAAWAGDDNKLAPDDWEPDWRAVWQTALSEYLLQPHEMLTGVPIKAPKACDINPGTVILYSGPWPATRTGGYGMVGRVGRVMTVSRDRDTMTATCDILIQAGDANSKRRFAPIARVLDTVDTLEERIDVATRTVYCYGDAYDHEGGSDVRWFAEPAWSDLGGDASVTGYQYDGSAWVATFAFEVESVSTVDHSITWKAGTFTGTFREREYTLIMMDPYASQSADWAKSLFIVNTNPAGKFGGAPGFKFVA